MGRLSYPPQLDSPSKQLVSDLARDLEQLRIHNAELKKVKAYERQSFYDTLDRADSEQEAVHNAALDQVAAHHGQLLEEAEEALRVHRRAVEEERRRKAEEERREAERVAREKAERQRREQEELARREAEQKAREEAKKKAEAEAEKKRLDEQAERERKEKQRVEEENRKRQAEAKKAEEEAARAKSEAEQKAQAERKIQGANGRPTEQEAKVHKRYLELHQHLKKFRQYMKDQGKTDNTIKQNAGDMRRTIKKCVGQLREGKGSNKNQLQEIKATLEKAASIPEPSVDIRQFLAFPPPEIANSENEKVPALLIYALNMFAKSLIASLLTEASLNHGHAEPVGIVAAQIFSMDAFIYKGCPMVDILWAKYRVVCPGLWGFYGSEKTEGGRKALGWWRDGPGGPYISEQMHAERMTALGAGFAALTLRNFGKTPRKNPFPNHIFWRAMHKILSVPPSDIQETHLILLSSMLKSSAERIVSFFGHVGLAMMRKAIVDLPSAVPRQSMGVTQLKLLKDLYKREKHIII